MSETTSHPQPSVRARELVRGAFDLHVHTGPDILKRSATDLDLARRFKESGLAGFVIKSHYVPSSARAAYARLLVPEVLALGSVVLNNAIGGLNVTAVEIGAREGARIVWAPTFDSANEMLGHATFPPGVKPPQWASLQKELREQGIATNPVAVLDESGTVLPALRNVLHSVAFHRLVFATGHLARNEIFAVVEAALREGVKDIVITHPDYPSQNLTADDQVVLAREGAFLEYCFAPAYSGKVPWERMFASIRAVGVERAFLSTDLGQPDNPPIEDGLPLMVDRLLGAGFTEDEVRVLAVTNTRRLALGEV